MTDRQRFEASRPRTPAMAKKVRRAGGAAAEIDDHVRHLFGLREAAEQRGGACVAKNSRSICANVIPRDAAS
jgi:hypothetical protein